MPFLTPDTPTATVGVSLQIPDTLMPAMVGAMADLCESYKWEKYGTLEIDETISLILEAILTLTEGGAPAGAYTPQIINIAGYSGINGNSSFTRQVNSAYKIELTTYGQSPYYVEYNIHLTPGTYQLDIWAERGSDKGILEVRWEGNSIGTFDMYAAGVSYDVDCQIQGIVCLTEKDYVMRLLAPTKNASSSYWWVITNHIEIVQTGA